MRSLPPTCLPSVESVATWTDSAWDCLILVLPYFKHVKNGDKMAAILNSLPGDLRKAVGEAKELDAAAATKVSLVKTPVIPSSRLILSPTGALDGDADDVRLFGEAAAAGVERAIAAGAKAPLLCCAAPAEVVSATPGFEEARLVTILGALHACYVPIAIRETREAKKIEKLGFFRGGLSAESGSALVRCAVAVEEGRIISRDIGGSDPERMAAPRVAEYVEQVFSNSPKVTYSIISDGATLEREYPCLGAVNRAARGIERHAARVIWLEYAGEGEVEETLFIIGKGITMDTGGADLKVGGVMAGMHRDKCGAASVAGFFKVLEKLRPKGLKVVGVMGMVRNSIGADAYVPDEIFTSRAGYRCRVGNTDAEGRMIMLDLLCHAKEKALTATNPHLFTIATLTYHALRAVGPDYTVVMDNATAKIKGCAHGIQHSGHVTADPFEISSLRREDLKFNRGKSEYEDLRQCNNASSGVTQRGHQVAMGFMLMGSGLGDHEADSATPIPYTHMDIVGSSGPFPGIPTGTPIPALTKHFVMPRIAAS